MGSALALTVGRKEMSQPSSNCLRTRRCAAPCATCGVTPDIVHMPIRERGLFCGDHCPACNGPEATP